MTGRQTVLRAETLRMRRTFTQAVPLAVLLFGLTAVRISHTPSLSASTDWNGGVLAWLSVLTVGFALPLAALTGALAEARDNRWRGGGTWWRSTSPRRIAVARTTVESAWFLLSLALLTSLILVDAATRGSFPVPWGRLAGLMALLWITMTGATAFGRILHRLTGTAAVGLAPVLALVWSVAGAVRAEHPGWWAEPWAWAPRASLPLLGTHGNSVPLDTDSPIWGWSALPGTGLSVLLAVIFLTGAVTPSLRWHITRPTGGEDHRPARKIPVATVSSVPAAAFRILPWRIWCTLAATLWTVTGLTRLVFPAFYAPRLFTLMAVPMTAAVVGTMMWTCARPGWRGVVARRSGVRMPVALALCAGLFTLAVLAVTAVITYAGNPDALGIPGTDGSENADYRGVYALMVTPAVALLVAGASYALAALGSPATAIVVNAAAAVWSLLITGDSLADSALWFSAYWGWADIAATHVGHWLLIWTLAATGGIIGITLVRSRSRKLGT